MAIEVRPARVFEDVRQLLEPKQGSGSCWCLRYRLPPEARNELSARSEYMAKLCRADLPPGVIAYDCGKPVGWAAVAPRSDTTYTDDPSVPHIDDLPVWSLLCIRVRKGHRRKGLSHVLLSGAVEFALDQGAPAIEAYPQNHNARIHMWMPWASSGVRENLERAGFVHRADIVEALPGIHSHPQEASRLLMRLDLR